MGAIQYGEFTLSSGQKSSYYFDGRLLSLHPRGAYLIEQLLLPIVRWTGAYAIGGPTIGADPIVTAVAFWSHIVGGGIPAFIVRKEAKGHGTDQLIEGPLVKGAPVVIVDDVCTTGNSLFHAINVVEAEAYGCKVVAVITILDRYQGGSDEIRKRGYSFFCILEATPEGRIRIADN